ncbi:MAG TPA: hypothetical protein VHL58_03710 [Thermoanaerobaculia bacterium]|nr:hypothetical protein [Thermoanaerobaculia bacterium]
MSKSRIAVVVIVIAAVAAVVYFKSRDARTVTVKGNTPAVAAAPARVQPAAPTPAAQRASVIALVDPREEGETHGCGAIIHLVREAKQQGVQVVELAPGSDSPLVKQHRILVNPTVLVVDANGQERARFEGEDGATIKAIEQELQKQKERARS